MRSRPVRGVCDGGSGALRGPSGGPALGGGGPGDDAGGGDIGEAGAREELIAALELAAERLGSMVESQPLAILVRWFPTISEHADGERRGPVPT